MATAIVAMSCLVLCIPSASAQPASRSHPPLRVPPPASKRTLAQGPTYFVDATNGDDKNDGSKASPWKTVNHAISRAKAGDTFYLRGGTYYENVRISLPGRKDAPITIASLPGEQAIIDGGIREFFEKPGDIWQPVDGSEGEYRSIKAYPNLRHVIGSFGDSMVGLVMYYHAKDLRASGELFDLDPATKDFKPIYCGPGIWYDPQTGHIHCRLRHTNVPGFENYRGETDPRKLPLVIAPFRSAPLRLDGAQHIRLQDLTIRGAGYDAVVLDQFSDIEFDNVTVWCGSYGMRCTGVQRLKFYRSALYGSIPPWLSRAESSLRTRPGSTVRDIARLNTHALLVPEAGREFSVYAFPFNDDWDISYSEFTDASDGIYLGGVSVKFHHNLVDAMQDDGIYLSPMHHRYSSLLGKAKLLLYQNHFSQAMTMLAFGGPEKSTDDTIYFFRNIIDLRKPVNLGRPSAKSPGPLTPYAGHVMGDHGSPPWPGMFIYHNTIITKDGDRYAPLSLSAGATAERPRRVFNNIIVHGKTMPGFTLPDSQFLQSDGNLYWQPGLEPKLSGSFFTAYRASPAFKNSMKAYPPGFDSNSKIADPMFLKFNLDAKAANDYRLQPGSPAIDAGVAFPADWPDPLRQTDKGKPDIGALPLGTENFAIGRSAAPEK